MSERPNTVAGLTAKRAELLKLRDNLEAEARKVTCDLDHLDAAIALFDPANAPASVQRYVTKHRAQKGTLKRFVLGYLRDRPGFYTSRQLTEAWAAARGLRTDEATYIILRKRMGACLAVGTNAGLLAHGPRQGEFKTWGAAP
jgi:hypothetical protein